ncbi:S9 family peptidase [Variovorax sp. Sphag1AA]|uniref:alpha/beta hydrolase family protein n=1 Tax=Variovorax sp. Sphag1AA TaxID=2587027 RepID=UPI00161F6E1B|nr:prolyl oligopeptidase family serine peptidase [Variovorax sp. Sphag1AA]MBB3179152.1 dienelactone hydrolase [Variovorax sp. Sphag1AA]
MKKSLLSWLFALGLFSGAAPALAAGCAVQDFEHFVSAGDECLVMARFGATDAPRTLVVWLHGDVSSGGPAVYHYAAAKEAAARFSAEGVLSVALVRPGYEDDEGRHSSGTNNGRRDHYTRANMQAVGAAITQLKDHFKPQRVVIVGHSGGAATAANLMGMMPGLSDADLLVACPCDLVSWRAGRKAWTQSENPMRWTDPIKPPVQVVAITGGSDDNTSPDLARHYVEALQAHGVNARFEVVPGASHNAAFRSPMVSDALSSLLQPDPSGSRH